MTRMTCTNVCITHHIAEQSKLTKSHLCGLKLKESAYFKKKIEKRKEKIVIKPHCLMSLWTDSQEIRKMNSIGIGISEGCIYSPAAYFWKTNEVAKRKIKCNNCS